MTVPAPGIAGRYGMRVRTPELPMAFTFAEFARGAGFALLAFQLVFPFAYPAVMLVMLIGAPPTSIESGLTGLTYGLLGIPFTFGYALPWSIGALMLVGGPAAWGLGVALRRIGAIRVHLLCFALLGAIVGAVTAWVACQTMGLFPEGSGALIFTAAGAIVTGASVAFGWRRTAKSALADDALFREHAGRPPLTEEPT